MSENSKKTDRQEGYSRGYLPHFDKPGHLQGVTFRLYDAVPSTLIQEWKQQMNWSDVLPATDPSLIAFHNRITRYEDAHHGNCWLRQTDIAQIVENTIRYFDGERYDLHAWCVMPNHVHALIETKEDWPLKGILHSWKSYSARQANRILKREGTFWFSEYYDRFIRNEEHYVKAVLYIENNPVKAGLIANAEEWQFSSARLRIH